MKAIRTIDLWTEQLENHLDCFTGAFVDGFESGDVPFDTYKVVRNCNCMISTNQPGLNISNKHNAIIFYKNETPVRLMVINRETDLDRCISEALNQDFKGQSLSNIYAMHGIKRVDVDLKQPPIINESNHEKEMDVGSCDRPSLLNSMLAGSYTESDTDLGKTNTDSNFTFDPDINIQYVLVVGDECFAISHRCAFINETMTRVIPLQDNSTLNIEEISKENRQFKI